MRTLATAVVLSLVFGAGIGAARTPRIEFLYELTDWEFTFDGLTAKGNVFVGPKTLLEKDEISRIKEAGGILVKCTENDYTLSVFLPGSSEKIELAKRTNTEKLQDATAVIKSPEGQLIDLKVRVVNDAWMSVVEGQTEKFLSTLYAMYSNDGSSLFLLRYPGQENGIGNLDALALAPSPSGISGRKDALAKLVRSCRLLLR